MADKRIKGITIELGGDVQPLNKALDEVNKHSRDIQSELKQVERLLKLDPKNTELLAQKQKLLTDAVSATKEKLDTLKEAQRQVEEQFKRGEIGEEQYRAVQREVIATEQNLKKLEKQLKEVNNSWKDTADKLNKFGKSTEELGKKMTPISAAAGAVGAGMIGMAVKAGQAADDLNTLAIQTGLSTDTLQKFKFASDLIDVPLETLTGSLARLTKRMGDAQYGTKRTQEVFEKLGISITDSTGTLRDNEEVFNEVINALAQIESEAERDSIAMELFGRKAQDLNPLILGGADALKQMGEEAEKAGLILSQDALDSINEFNDEIDILKATAGQTMMQLGVSIGGILLPVLQDLAQILKDVVRWVRGLDENTLKLILIIAGLVAAIAPTLIMIGKMAAGLSAIINLIGGAGGLSGMLTALTGPIGVAIAAIAAITAAIIYLWNTNEEFREGVIVVWEQIKEAFKVALDYIQELVTSVVSWLTAFWQANGETIKNFTKLIWDTIANTIQAGLTIISGLLDVFIGLFTGDWERFGEGLKKIWEGLWDGIKAIVEGAWNLLKGAFKLLYNNISNWFKNLIADAKQWGKDIISGLIEGIKSMIDKVKNAVSNVVSTVTGGVKSALKISSPSRVMVDLGEHTGEGFLIGLTSVIGDIEKRISRLSPSVVPASNTASAAGGLTIINEGTVVGRGGMEELAEIISRSLAGRYGLGTGGVY